MAVAPAGTESWCTTDTARGWHVFHVCQYSLAKTLGVGRFVRSAHFGAGGFTWAVRVYPSGKSSPQQLSVSLDLLAGPAAEARALYALALVDRATGRRRSLFADGKATQFQVFHVTTADNPLLQIQPGDLPSPRSAAAGAAVEAPTVEIDRKECESAAYLQGDQLEIRCEVTVLLDPRVSAAQRLPRIPPPAPALARDLGDLLEARDAADVTFRVGGEAFAAHSQVLAARSPVLRAALLQGPAPAPSSMDDDATNDGDGGRRVTVEDVDPDVFRALLRFLYTDELPPPGAAEEGPNGGGGGMREPETEAETWRRLLAAADRYGVERLRRVCESALCDGLDARTARATLALAERHGCEKLRRACLEFLAASDPESFIKRRKMS